MANTRTLISFVLNTGLKVAEVTDVDDPTLDGPLPGVVDLGGQVSLNSTTTPAVEKTWHARVTLSSDGSSSSGSSQSSPSSSSGSSSSGFTSGSAVLDLTDLTDPIPGLNVDATGLKLTVLHVTGDSDNQQSITIVPGTGDGYSGWGTGLILAPGDEQVLKLNGTTEVGPTEKNLLLMGASGDSLLVCLAFG